MTPIVQKLKDVKPDILIAISFPNDAILFQRKAKELDFNIAAFIGVSAGYSSPDLRNSIGSTVNGIFVADFPPKVNPDVLNPEIRKVADEFYKRYEAKMKRPPAGHAAAGFSAIWALFTDVLPKAKTFEPDELRDCPQAHLPEGSGKRQRDQVHNFDWRRSQGCRTKSARLDWCLAVTPEPTTSLPGEASDPCAGHGAADWTSADRLRPRN
jgi:branched-chain amino acid transport system substrate-binding protein